MTSCLRSCRTITSGQLLGIIGSFVMNTCAVPSTLHSNSNPLEYSTSGQSLHDLGHLMCFGIDATSKRWPPEATSGTQGAFLVQND